jgi:lipopolysaccharide transport system ATP-binding protein
MSEREVVISVNNLGKSYRIWRDPSARLKAPLVNAIKGIFSPFWPRKEPSLQDDGGRMYNRNRYFQDFRALRGVSLELRRGDSVGIIGRNGSGKSTLLQMIAGTLTPTEGSVETKGRVAALLELGAGFNDEFTGRENVYLNGAILGLSKREIDARFERIVEFANIGEFIDQPIKTYSSGMRVRLAFAVQAEVDPDILIVDEALSVGDIRFTMKCIRRMKELIERNTTLLFVSHDLSSIVNFCKEVIWVHDGEVVRRGDPRAVTLEYSNFMHYGVLTQRPEDAVSSDSTQPHRDASGDPKVLASASEIRARSNTQGSYIRSSALFRDPASLGLDDLVRWEDIAKLPSDGNRDAVFLHAALQCRDDPDKSKLFEGGESVVIFLHVRALRDVPEPLVCADLYDLKGNLITGSNSCFVTSAIEPMRAGMDYVFRFETRLPLLRNGDYTVLFGLSNGSYREHEHVYGVAEALTFELKSGRLSQRHQIVSFEDQAIMMHAIPGDEVAHEVAPSALNPGASA